MSVTSTSVVKGQGAASKRVVYAALFGNLLVALVKFAAAWWTGSSAMLSEAIHSLADTSNELLLLYGMYRATLPPDDVHPLGHGRELYFWSFLVSLLMFVLGAGASIYEGITRIVHPVEIIDPTVSYVVLGLSFVFEFTTWRIALKRFRKVKGSLGYLAAIRQSKDPPSFIVLLEDSAALIGLGIVLAGTLAADWLGLYLLDGAAAVGVGLLLAGVAWLLARETKELLIGESASRSINDSILKLAASVPGIERTNGLLTVQLAPTQIVAALSVEFRDDMTAPQIEAAVSSLEDKIKAAHPQVVTLFVKPQTPASHREGQEEIQNRAAGRV